MRSRWVAGGARGPRNGRRVLAAGRAFTETVTAAMCPSTAVHSVSERACGAATCGVATCTRLLVLAVILPTCVPNQTKTICVKTTGIAKYRSVLANSD
jgi:hypothetical protein